MDETAAVLAYRPVEPLSRQFSNALRLPDASARLPSLYGLLKRALLHPELVPYRADPLRTLAGEFVSLDARLPGLEALATRHGLTEIPETEAVGVLQGAVYLPGAGRAIPVVVRVACDTGAKALAYWQDPVCVWPVSPTLQASAVSAFHAALALLSKLPDVTVYPVSVWFDVQAETALEGVAGDSLGLPLALAFLSALTDVPLPANLAATGCVAGDDVLQVEYVTEKRTAWPASRWLIPCEVATFAEAARLVSARFEVPATLPEAVPRPVSGPEGLTLLLTEIENATRYWQTDPAGMRTVARDFEVLVRRVCQRHSGYLFGARERFSVAFAKPGDACDAGIALLQATRRHLWQDGFVPLPVRVAVHRGQVEWRQNGGDGPAVGQAARVLEASHGGQLLVTDAVRRAVPDETSVIWTDVGSHRLRDLKEPVSLWQLTAPSMPDTFPPPRSLEARRHNLPVQATSLVGRDAERSMLTALLTRKAHPLVTLTGPGGVGKTRLALQVAADALDAFPGGIWFIVLDEVAASAESVARAVADVLELGETAKKKPLQAIADAVRERRVLLVLDNFESVLPDGADFVTSLLRQVSGVTCLVTSREALRLSAEHRFEVKPLTVPEDSATEDELRESAAVGLFCERAGVSEPLITIAAICRRLDGLPLAIELAAARAKVLSLPEIEERLADAFSLLVSRLRDVPKRQRTLLSTLEWSYNLLPDDEKRLLRVLSVFIGGITNEAARVVTGDPAAMDGLASLEEKSLLQAISGSRSTRFRLLSLVQEFAKRKLAETNQEVGSEREETEIRSRHAAYFADLATKYGSAYQTPEEISAFDRLDTEKDNLRVAFATLYTQEPSRLPVYVADLLSYLRRRGQGEAWREWPRLALKVIDAGTVSPGAEIRATLYHACGMAHRNAGEIPIAEDFALSALRFALHSGDSLSLSEVFALHADLALRRKGYAEANALYGFSLHHARVAKSIRREIAARNNLGHVALQAGETETARRHLEHSLTLSKAAGDRTGRIQAQNSLALILFDAGEFAQAREAYWETLVLARQLRDSLLVGQAQRNVAIAESYCGMPHALLLPALVASEEIMGRLGHRARNEVAEIIDGLILKGPEDKRDTLRHDFALRPLDYLLAIEPPASPLVLTLAASDHS